MIYICESILFYAIQNCIQRRCAISRDSQYSLWLFLSDTLSLDLFSLLAIWSSLNHFVFPFIVLLVAQKQWEYKYNLLKFVIFFCITYKQVKILSICTFLSLYFPVSQFNLKGSFSFSLYFTLSNSFAAVWTMKLK